jgi:hypothetical protein
MLSALLSFLGGSVFRMLWGEISAFINKRQDNAHELQMLQLQSDIDDRAHTRNQEAMQLQAQLGIKTIEAQSQAMVDKAEADAFGEAMARAFGPTGYSAVDIWNGIVRPAAATIALALWVCKLITQDFRMADWDMELVGAILGFFFADRSLGKRGK